MNSILAVRPQNMFWLPNLKGKHLRSGGIGYSTSFGSLSSYLLAEANLIGYIFLKMDIFVHTELLGWSSRPSIGLMSFIESHYEQTDKNCATIPKRINLSRFAICLWNLTPQLGCYALENTCWINNGEQSWLARRSFILNTSLYSNCYKYPFSLNFSERVFVHVLQIVLLPKIVSQLCFK